jgi:hypothetical protein
VAIEFLDPPEYAPLPEAPAEAIGGEERRRLRFGPSAGAVGAAVLLAGAAVLPVFAAFATVFVERIGGTAQGLTFATDAWGRERHAARYNPGFPPGLHDPRYGVVLCCCAGGLLVAAAVLLIGGLRFRLAPLLAGAASAALALAGVTAGIAAAMWLAVRARTDSLNASFRADRGQFADQVRIHVSLGAAFWLAAAGAVAALLAALACWWLRRAESG